MRTILLFSLFLSTAQARTQLVKLKAKNFSSPTLKVSAGDYIEFRNDDSVYHSVYSLSDTTSFDLGSFGPSEVRRVQFNKPGKVEVNCAVHRGMKLLVDVH